MSRIGKSPVTIPSGVDVKVDSNVVTVKGPKGELIQEMDSCVTMPINPRKLFRLMSLMLTPSIKISPFFKS